MRHPLVIYCWIQTRSWEWNWKYSIKRNHWAISEMKRLRVLRWMIRMVPVITETEVRDGDYELSVIELSVFLAKTTPVTFQRRGFCERTKTTHRKFSVNPRHGLNLIDGIGPRLSGKKGLCHERDCDGVVRYRCILSQCVLVLKLRFR